jgi:deferrochelatase/peroxidase EfeB
MSASRDPREDSPDQPPAEPAAPSGPDTPAAGPDTPAGGPDTPAGGPDTPAGGPDTPAGGPDTPAGGPPRRSFLRGALGAGVTGAVGGVLAGAAGGYAYRSAQTASAGQALSEHGWFGRLPAVPFHGEHQAGILLKPHRQTVVVSFTSTADGRAELTDLLRTLTDRARFLTAGGTPPPEGIGGPPPDSGVLGPPWCRTA